MPFDPKIVPPDPSPWDDGADLELPDDLAALGEQLRDDAAYLAERYPARRDVAAAGTARRAAAARRPRRMWLAAASAAAIVLLLAGSFTAWRWVSRQSPGDNVTAGVPVTAPSAEVQPEGETPRATHPTPVSNDVPAAVLPTVPAVFLQNVSGPELEGMLDLMEHEPEGDPGLSI